MKLILRRLLACVMAVMFCMAAFSIPAYAEGGDYYEYELPPNENPDVLYPQGNMTIVSDISGEAANEKEFITVVSKNGNYFYIIIDRSADGENTVHFLNKVDEADLLSLLSEDEREAYLQAQQPAATPEPTPMPTPTPTPTPVPSQEPQPVETDARNEARATVLIGLIALMAVLIILFLRSKKGGKSSAKGSVNLDDYDFGDDDEIEDENYVNFEKYDPDAEVGDR